MKSIFRKKTIETVSSPEQLNDYIKVTNPSIWLVIGSSIVFIAAVFVWSIVGTMDISVDTKAYSDGKNIYCYLSENQINEVSAGMDVKIGNKTEKVEEVEQIPDDYSSMKDKLGKTDVLHALRISEDEWRYLVKITADKTDSGIVDATIVIDRVSPITYVFN